MFEEATVIIQDSFEVKDDTKTNYRILFGHDMQLTQLCDQQWAKYNIELFEYIKDSVDESDLNAVLESIQLEDKHWNWFNKSIRLYSASYKWFYLLCGDDIQASCVIYQPKQSSFSNNNIFYIEFIAVAPWNRKNILHDKRYNGIGTLLITSVLRYATDTLGLTPGFSLHSLPQATGYYEQLGMLHCPSEDKERLKYYEIPREKAILLLEGDKNEKV